MFGEIGGFHSTLPNWQQNPSVEFGYSKEKLYCQSKYNSEFDKENLADKLKLLRYCNIYIEMQPLKHSILICVSSSMIPM